MQFHHVRRPCFAGPLAGRVQRCHWRGALLVLAMLALPALANPPVAKYVFPAGAQRGTTANVKVGGCFFHGDAGFELLDPNIQVSPRIREVETVWFEGPLIPQPASQQAEDYPRDHAAAITVPADARPGVRLWRAWTSQGATAAMRFVVGDLPEVVEKEADGPPVAVDVTMPVTINGRIFPREDVDAWAFEAAAGQAVTCDVMARRLGSPLEAQVEVLDPAGRPVAARPVWALGDPRLHFVAAVAGRYQVRIHDVGFGGLQNYVYRLTVTAGPFVDAVYPLGGQRGARTRFELTGHGLTAAAAEAEVPAHAREGWQHAFEQGGKRTNPVAIEADDLPEVLEAEPNDRPGEVAAVDVPAVLNGRIGRAGDVDWWAISAKKDQLLDVDLRAGRLGSPLDSVVTVQDAAAKQLARNDDMAAGQPDSQLSFKAPADGVYYICVEDRFASRGGPAFAYRLRVTAAAPDFGLTLAADAVTLPRTIDAPAQGSATADKKAPAAPPVTLKVDAQRLGGFDGAIALTIDGLPDGVTATETVIPAKKPGTLVRLSAAPGAKIGVSHLRVRGVAEVAGKPVTRGAAVAAVAAGGPSNDDLLLAVAMPTPFRSAGLFEQVFVPCGSVYRRRYLLDRGGFAGPLTVRLADRQARHLQGVTGPTIVVPPDAQSFDYPVTLAAEMELGRTSRSCVMVSGTVRDADGSEHVVSHSSIEQPDQFVAVATAPLLAVSCDRTSVAARAGETVEIKVRVRRATALAGRPVRVALLAPPSAPEASAETVIIPGEREDGVIRINFASSPGVANGGVTLRATVEAGGDPHRSEVRIDLTHNPSM